MPPFCPSYWHQAITAKGGIYALNQVLSAGALLSLLLYRQGSQGRFLYLFSLLAGLAMAHHYMSFLTLVPAFILLLWPAGPEETKFQAKKAALASFMFLCGFAVYPCYLLIRSGFDPPMNWGNPST